jgi:hypothetical protein
VRSVGAAFQGSSAVYPGATTYPDTSVYPGQGETPFVPCLIISPPSFADAAAQPYAEPDIPGCKRARQVLP